MHGQRGDLLVGLAAVVAVVRLARRVDHVVLVQAGVLGEALLTAGYGAHVRLLTCGNEPVVSKDRELEAFGASAPVNRDRPVCIRMWFL